ncbi:MAG: tRNA (guanosine(37)-N1)-methyltransferase TrmD [Parcubacteria group bacterium RIFCSPLOWO2_01_FULL_40_65]|nr:MAG: tRNA (guanosine(37)-N1)-methyltransferase TrmD [Parcubacteria group bacterium RIFCSPHIGHO2_01_FULL_40_30]OHB19081.1 MAG: tRNA (guanosine(37)-N1)-methyltransferase TrmD [Parcubacteria group bacterium RIFCSPHIGHO2_02_FULL_40_12]OHB21341.1 MAG: tRNA (guanosine(37)-N1)-methyltransferase TrmD [Parcubacteria group bacterium RIFCSPLOWO2_01_FULL_40_65]OHB23056.1 MAG: tRNA (guanosine(37)-N1)-methyltransferase TrmD [Parcubacteria group bacterium RIFCSPLOWO2_02_FULL_40_12]
MKFDVITIFPEIFDSFLKESLLYKAQEKKIIQVKIHNLRNWATGKHQIVDDSPYGGGPGMVLKIEPIYKAVKKIKNQKSKIIFLSPRGKKFTQKTAQNWAKNLKQLVIVSGRYEGIDERVKKLADETISVGDFITLGGEIPTMAIIEAVARLVPGVVGKKTSIEKLDFPQYTRPEVFSPKKGIKWTVPKVLVSGNHKKIEEWRKKQSKEIK